MAPAIYDDSEEKASPNYNTVCVALARNGKRLCKIVSPGGEIPFDNAYYYKFFNEQIESLQDLFQLVQYLLHRPQCCLIRGVAKDDSVQRQRRLFQGDSTIIEQEQNWFALDIDGFSESTGDLKIDHHRVLLALNMNVESFAIPSAGYLRKPGIHIRIFMWNLSKVTCSELKKYFTRYKDVVDLALFHPIQPIYTARPLFNGCCDPCNKLWSWHISDNQFVNVPKIYTDRSGRHEELYTRKQADRFLKTFLRKVFQDSVASGHRHSWLFGVSVALGKWIEQDLLDEEETVELLYLATATWKGDRKKDMQTILDGIKRGKLAMEGVV